MLKGTFVYLNNVSFGDLKKDLQEYFLIKKDIRKLERIYKTSMASITEFKRGNQKVKSCIRVSLNVYSENELRVKRINYCPNINQGCYKVSCQYYESMRHYKFVKDKLEKAVAKKQNFWQKKIQKAK